MIDAVALTVASLHPPPLYLPRTRMSATASIGHALGILVRGTLPLAILAGGWYAYSLLAVAPEESKAPPAKKQAIRTKVIELAPQDYQVVVTTHGEVQSHNRVSLTSEVAGIIKKINPALETGAYFDAGDVLIEIDDRNYVTAVAMARARHAGSESALELARLTEERKLRLVESNAVPRAEVDAASATREQAEADLESAAAQLEQAQLDLERTKVSAPFDGRVELKYVGVGQMAGPNTPLADIFAVDYAEVRLPINARQRQFLQLPEFADDDAVEVSLRDALNAAIETVWDAKIVRTEGVLDQNSRDLFAIARIDDPFGRESGKPPLRIGQPVVASIAGKVLEDVMALPQGAVRQLDQIVMVDKEDLTLSSLNINAIWSDKQHVVVDRSEIPEGRFLATTHLVFVPEGAQVEIIPDIEAASVADADANSTDKPVAN